MLTYSTDPYGVYIARSDGSQTRHFTKFCLPKELPEMQGTKIVNIYQMDEGLNHPGYRVFDTRKIDISHFDFEVVLGQVSITDLDWLEGLFQNEKQILLSWKTGFNVFAIFQPNGFVPGMYPLNVREFGHCRLSFHLVGETSTSFAT